MLDDPVPILAATMLSAGSSVSSRDETFMLLALAEARAALERGEVPVGCVLVNSDGVVVAAGGNETNEACNATRHAELVALDAFLGRSAHSAAGSSASVSADAPSQLGGVPAAAAVAESTAAAACDSGALCELELFVTVEPCIMCAAALAKLRVKRVCFGCHNDRFGGCGSVMALHEGGGGGGGGAPFPIVAGVRAAEAIALLRDFYSRSNPSVTAPAPRPAAAAGAVPTVERTLELARAVH